MFPFFLPCCVFVFHLCLHQQGFVLLCEVALGEMMRLRQADSSLTLDKVNAKGFNSTMGEGKTILDSSGDETLFVASFP